MLFCPRCYKLWDEETDVSACDCGYAIDQMETTPQTHPVQLVNGKRGQIRAEVAMAAYEVYCHLFTPQNQLVTGGCRGGFGAGEIIAFLYAKSFPKSEWRHRVDEAFDQARIEREKERDRV